MRVALDVSAVPATPAGAGRYIVEIARRLPAMDVSTTLVTRRDDAKRWAAWSPDALLAPVVPTSRGRRLWYEAGRLGRSATARGVDVWHGPHYTMPRRATTPCVVTIHDLTFFTNPEWHERAKVAYFRRAIEYSARHAAVLISVSDFTARLMDEVLADHAPVVVAPHGVDLERFTTEQRDDELLFRTHALPWGVAFVLFVGTLEPRKGLDVLAAAFEEVARTNPEVELWIAGQRGWGQRSIDALVARHPASARIRRLGFVDDEVLPALFRQAHCVAYPSRGEGFGLPVLEAMACGATVVTSAGTVMAEVAGGHAILTTPGDSTALAEAVNASLALDQGERRARALAARARAELFTWDASLERHVQAYQRAAGGR
ncbi:MAG TPA: glycosyltransferase family 1 protein [Acidimicrobiales bacterium]|nr:glycosyltransferase family 1 protein [Acidimicrobiales bacterium]